MRIAICLPTVGRAAQFGQRMDRLLQPTLPADVESLYLVVACMPDDHDTRQQAARLAEAWDESDVIVITTLRPQPSTAVDGWNMAYNSVADICDWFVLGADDIEWSHDWLGNAVGVIGDNPHVQCIGLNDLHTDLTKYAPHYMIGSEFCREALGGHLVPPMYKSWWFDREVCEIAQQRGEYFPGWGIVAAHTHPDWGTAEMDSTYQKARRFHNNDRAIYLHRRQAGFPLPAKEAK